METKKIKRPRVKEKILDMWNKGMTVGEIAIELKQPLFYVVNKLKYYGEFPKDLI